MTLSEIYETALCLGEKTDDATGYIDDEYMRQHKMKAFEIIRQCIIKLSAIENIEIVHPEKLEEKSEVNLPLFMTKVIIPAYTAAILCQQDGEEDKYNILICEYRDAISMIKHEEDSLFGANVLEGLV